MEIAGISYELSGSGKVALILRPSLTREIFAEIRKLSVTPLLSSLAFEYIGGCLVFHCSGGVTEHICKNILAMLKAAEETAQETHKIDAGQTADHAKLEQVKKNYAVNTAAEIFGVPIQ